MLTSEEIAAEVGGSPSAIGMTLARAIRKFKAELQRRGLKYEDIGIELDSESTAQRMAATYGSRRLPPGTLTKPR